MNNAGYNKNQPHNNGRNRPRAQSTKEKQPFVKLTKKNCVSLADERMNGYVQKEDSITTTKIRLLLSLILKIYSMVHINGNKELDEDAQSKVLYVKMKFAYEAGRDDRIMNFMNHTQLMENLAEIKNDKEYLLLVCKYMEALVAYYKFYGVKNHYDEKD